MRVPYFRKLPYLEHPQRQTSASGLRNRDLDVLVYYLDLRHLLSARRKLDQRGCHGLRFGALGLCAGFIAQECRGLP